MYQAQNRETKNSTWKASVSSKIIMTTSVTKLCFTTQHKTCKTKTNTDFLVSDQSCPKTDSLRPRHWFLGRWVRAPLPPARGSGRALKAPQRSPGQSLGANRFLYNFWPLDDHWRLRLLPLISCVCGKIWGQLALASQSQLFQGDKCPRCPCLWAPMTISASFLAQIFVQYGLQTSVNCPNAAYTTYCNTVCTPNTTLLSEIELTNW